MKTLEKTTICSTTLIDGELFAKMIRFGAENLKKHKQEVNELNVFPIPDGDTGDNMLLTVEGGISKKEDTPQSICDASRQVSNNMLFSARGNSGVILSQFFEGIRKGFENLASAQVEDMTNAFKQGVEQAYHAVIHPVEGTILTVAREATEYACKAKPNTIEEFFCAFIEEAERSLLKTTELLPALKNAGVVDSGAAGFIYIIKGMVNAITEVEENEAPLFSPKEPILNLDAFTEDSILEFGYCTEVLLRLQNSKTDIKNFNEKEFSHGLQMIGDSVVVVKNGSIVKLHVHAEKPEEVLSFCHEFGEFLKVKIENMTLQHSSLAENKKDAPTAKIKKYGFVATASGEGLKKFFIDRGVDVIVDGGQSMNPSAEDFLNAFEKTNAETIFVFPNNSNIILTAKQAASLYKKSDVLVVESKNIGAGYAALSMFDESLKTKEEIFDTLQKATENVITAQVSRSIRDAHIDDTFIMSGDYIGFYEKKLIATGKNRENVALQTVENLNFNSYDICILIYGADVNEKKALEVQEKILQRYPEKEVFIYDGMQQIYEYIIILE